MKLRFKSMYVAAAVLATASGAVLAGGAALPANAATSTSCTSKLVKTATLTSGTGNTLGQGRLYSNGNGGWCGMTVHTGSFVGKATVTEVYVDGAKLNGTENGSGGADDGTYSNYAGPALASGPCVHARFSMNNAKHNHGGSAVIYFGCTSNNHVATASW
ncbi:hypothetical protein P9139_18210 [Curtobacterium flaccumfaciens]|nr:hypothetical protein P9139_18210 [Curtobacterium flaccumfaciens]